MEAALPNPADKFLSLKEASRLLSVNVGTLLDWNENNILKPTISQSGEVGYTQAQIDKFIAIHAILQNRNENKLPAVISSTQLQIPNHNPAIVNTPVSSNLHLSTPPNYSATNPGAETNSALKTISTKKTRNYTSFALISSLSVMLIFLTVVSFVGNDNVKNSSNPAALTSRNKTGIDGDTNTQLTEVKFLKSPIATLPVHNEANSPTGSNLVNSDIPGNEYTLIAQNLILGKNTDDPENDEGPSLIPFAVQQNLGRELNNSGISNFASRPNNGNNETIFDAEGNIRGETSTTGPVATMLGTTGIYQGSALKQTSPLNIWVFLLSFGALSIILAFKKQPVHTGTTTLTDLYGPKENTVDEKIIEIDQKTDGTVVLSFMGTEYKLSKPEMNSESDQFIERLLGFSEKEVKEINYDILEDAQITLNAPLSKLVTRLGFVGLKRDLFFPRTSKNRVLFRRYLTRQDLTSMGLSADKLSKELIN